MDVNSTEVKFRKIGNFADGEIFVDGFGRFFEGFSFGNSRTEFFVELLGAGDHFVAGHFFLQVDGHADLGFLIAQRCGSDNFVEATDEPAFVSAVGIGHFFVGISIDRTRENGVGQLGEGASGNITIKVLGRVLEGKEVSLSDNESGIGGVFLEIVTVVVEQGLIEVVDLVCEAFDSGFLVREGELVLGCSLNWFDGSRFFFRLLGIFFFGRVCLFRSIRLGGSFCFLFGYNGSLGSILGFSSFFGVGFGSFFFLGRFRCRLSGLSGISLFTFLGVFSGLVGFGILGWLVPFGIFFGGDKPTKPLITKVTLIAGIRTICPPR